MGKGAKTDNHAFAGKLDLRRHFLARHHADSPPRVIDCCQGSGKLWGQLRREFAVASYWGMDLKPKAGRLKIDSSRVLSQKGWRADVVDVDSYGSPWAHWLALLPNVTGPLSVFLTVGEVQMNGGGTDTAVVKDYIGLRFPTLRVPKSLGAFAVREVGLPAMLAAPLGFGLRVVEAAEAPRGYKARYFGLRLEPALPREGAAGTS